MTLPSIVFSVSGGAGEPTRARPAASARCWPVSAREGAHAHGNSNNNNTAKRFTAVSTSGVLHARGSAAAPEEPLHGKTGEPRRKWTGEIGRMWSSPRITATPTLYPAGGGRR